MEHRGSGIRWSPPIGRVKALFLWNVEDQQTAYAVLGCPVGVGGVRL